MTSFIIWSGNPELFSIGSFSLRWYGMLFAQGFLISQQVLYYIFKKEGKPESDVDILTVYMVLATLIGARLGHVIFYQPEMLWEDPLGVFLPVEFTPTFRFVGLRGLASHGATIGVLTALWVYSRKKLPGQSYLQTLDRIVIVVALTGGMVRLGNFFNSEIIGKPTTSSMGVVFAGSVVDAIKRDQTMPDVVRSVQVEKATQTDSASGASTKEPILFRVSFKPGITRPVAEQYVNSVAGFYLLHMADYVTLPAGPFQYEINGGDNGNDAQAVIHALGIVRHPAQLYEMASSFLLFIALFAVWARRKRDTPEGLIFGVFMIVLWTLRFFYEFLKENQEVFEDSLPLNMGQLLSLPMILVGIVVLVRVYKKKDMPAPR